MSEAVRTADLGGARPDTMMTPTKWNGSMGGGHHRDGTLSFPQLKNRGQTVTLTLRGIADVPERTFIWKVN